MPLRNYVVDNFWWKLLSLLLASLTWLTIETAFQKDQGLREVPVVTSARRSFPAVPITLLTSSLNTNQYRVDPSMIPVEVKGTAAELGKLQEREIRVFVDVTEAREEIKLRRTIQVQVPPGLEATNLGVSPYVIVERISPAK